jgi:protein-disulfide isomerase
VSGQGVKAKRDRANARRVVEEQKARERRRRVTLWTSVTVVAVLLVAGLVGWGVLAGQRKGTATVPPGAVDAGTAFARGSGPVTVDLYEDFMCPICRQFESQSGSTITQLVDQHKVTVRYHPIAILDGSSSGTQYSTRAAAASAAAAVGGKFVEYHDVLYANQPAEGSTGLTDARLIELGRSVGLTGQAFPDAVTHKTYWAWVTKSTDTAAARGYTSTPTVLVAGKQVTGAGGGYPTPDVLIRQVAAATS